MATAEHDAGVRFPSREAAAARTHQAILDTARTLLRDVPTTSTNEIAKSAGVGPGTLYRHFPTRADLILAVYRSDIDRLVASVEPMLEAQPAAEAFITWFDDLAGLVRVKHGLGDALNTEAAQSAIDDSYAPVTDAIGALIRAGVAQGSIRADVDASDVLLLMGFLWRTPSTPEGAEQAERIQQVVLRGLAPA